jgi:hypothetical protein
LRINGILLSQSALKLKQIVGLIFVALCDIWIHFLAARLFRRSLPKQFLAFLVVTLLRVVHEVYIAWNFAKADAVWLLWMLHHAVSASLANGDKKLLLWPTWFQYATEGLVVPIEAALSPDSATLVFTLCFSLIGYRAEKIRQAFYTKGIPLSQSTLKPKWSVRIVLAALCDIWIHLLASRLFRRSFPKQLLVDTLLRVVHEMYIAWSFARVDAVWTVWMLHHAVSANMANGDKKLLLWPTWFQYDTEGLVVPIQAALSPESATLVFALYVGLIGYRSEKVRQAFKIIDARQNQSQ